MQTKEIECQNYVKLQKEKRHLADERNRMSELHKNPEGKEKHCADERNRMSELHKNPEGIEKHCADERNGMSE